MSRSFDVLIALGLLSGACGGAAEPGGCVEVADLGGDTPLPAEIDDILERQCRTCHSDPPSMFAPMPLLSWQDVQAVRYQRTGERVFEVIGRRIHDEDFPMPPLPSPSLSDAQVASWPTLTGEELDTLDAWVADCAPAAE